ncbi:MAG TPA: hypothetical protein VFS12_18030 [Terriglobia bacterium]|nr:hypothetical protein [Terriglobia bacterium]
MRLHLAGALLTTLVCVGRAHAGETKAPSCDAMVGVWEYVEPSAPGHAIVARQGSKYLGIFVNTLPEPYTGQTTTRTGGGKAQANSYAVAGAWEYTCEAASDKLRLTLRWLYSSYQPQDLGSEAVLEVELRDRQAKWWFIGADGKRGAMGAGQLLR